MRRSQNRRNWNVKQCSACGKLKDIAHFGHVGKKGDAKGLRGKCSECHRDFMNNNQKKYAVARRDSDLMKKYNISLDDYNRMMEEQKGECAICHQKDPHQSLAVDHCHTTGKVRGLLCCMCNRGLGNFYDDISRLSKAIEYLR